MKSGQASARSRWTFAAVSTALFCLQIDYFAMNLALPRMAQDLGSDTTNLQWVVSVYMLALGAFMTPAGRTGDIFGRRSGHSNKPNRRVHPKHKRRPPFRVSAACAN